MLIKKVILCGLLFIIMYSWILVNPSLSQDGLVFIDLKKINEPELVDRIVSYYRLERTKEWSETYKFRPKKFWKTVPYDVYERIMEEDSAGYDLYKIKIDLVEREYREGGMTPVFHIWAIFYELITDQNKLTGSGYADIYGTGDVHAGSDRMTWVLEDDQWKCLACGIRSHMTLNVRFD